MKNKGLFQNLRSWLDGAEDDSLDEIIKAAPPRKADEFMTKIAKRLDGVLQDEMFVPLNKDAQIPAKFIVFLNKIDDALWQTSKRSALEETLSENLLERAKELAAPNHLSVSEIEVELKLDNTLAHPMMQVSAVWEGEKEQLPFVEQPTVIEDGFFNYAEKSPLFSVKVSNQFASVKEAAFYKNEILIGRGKSDEKIDIVLTEATISRLHAKLIYQESGNFALTNVGKNTIWVGNEAVLPETTHSVGQFQDIRIGSFSLVLHKGEVQFSNIVETVNSPNFVEFDKYRTTRA